MKNLSEFIYESLVFEAANTTDEQKYMIKSLSKHKDLKNYVKYLEAMLEDDDARNVLLKAFFNSTSKDAYKFNVKIHALPILQLHPTQNEIDIDNSLGFPFSGGKKNQDENRKMCVNNFYGSKKKDPEMVLGFPLITFNGKYIIDGHHRWSQAFSFVPEGTIKCFDMSVPNGKIDEQEMLKIVQGLIAARVVKRGNKSMPSSVVKEGNNVFKKDEKQVLDHIKKSYIEKYPEAAEALTEGAIGVGYLEKGASEEDFAKFLTANLMKLKDENLNYARKGNNREVMPQTGDVDDGVDKNDKNTLLNKIKDGEVRVNRHVIGKGKD